MVVAGSCSPGMTRTYTTLRINFSDTNHVRYILINNVPYVEDMYQQLY